VGAAANEAWARARAGVVALFTQAGRRREVVEQWVDETATEIESTPVAARDQVRQRLAPEWADRLVRLLEEFPELEGELRRWAAQVLAELPAAPRAWVQTFVARDDATQYNAPQGSITVLQPRHGHDNAP
jgi:hypothetical protein